MKALTRRQNFVIEQIRAHISEHGFPPTIGELRVRLGLNTKRGVTVHLDALERKGLITRGSSARSIRILADAPNCPDPSPRILLANIAHGAQRSHLRPGYFYVSEALVREAQTFLFPDQVHGGTA